MPGVIDWSQDFGGSLGDGTAVTTSNLTGDQFRQVTIGAGNLAEIDTGAPLAGTRSLRLVKGSGSITRTQLYAYLGTGTGTVSIRTRMRFTALPAVSETLFRAFTGATGSSTPTANRFDIILTSTGKIQIVDSQAGGSNASSATNLSAATTYWLEALYTSGVPSGGGTATVKVYPIGSATAAATVSLATLPSLTVNEMDVGEISANASNLEILLDDLAFGHGDYLARTDITAVPPTVVGQADKQITAGSPVTLTATATSTAPATISSIVATCTAAPPGVTPGTITFTNTLTASGQTGSVSSTSTGNLTTPGTYTITFTVTDSNANTSTDTVTVWAATATAVPESVVTAGGAIVVTGSSELAALGDGATDTSYATYVTYTTPAGTVREYKLQPAADGTLSLTVHAKMSAAGTGTILLEIIEGTTNRTPGRTPASLTTTMAAYSVTPTTPELSAITDRTNLRARITMSAS